MVDVRASLELGRLGQRAIFESDCHGTMER